MKNAVVKFFVLFALLVSCATINKSDSASSVVRVALDVPESFQSPDGLSLDRLSCKNPMVDGRNGTKIILVRSVDGKGDYKVPDEMYGVGQGELLRLDCSTGKAIGIVKER